MALIVLNDDETWTESEGCLYVDDAGQCYDVAAMARALAEADLLAVAAREGLRCEVDEVWNEVVFERS